MTTPAARARRRARRSLALAALALGSLAGCAPRPRAVTALAVVADPGPFGSLEQAAAAAASVDWWDADPRDDEACTAGFAASELERFLPAALGLPAEAVRNAGALPDTGDVIVLAGPHASGPLASLAAAAGRPGSAAGGFRLRALERGGRRILVVAGDDRAGLLHGAYALLDRLGTRFAGLGDSGIVTAPAPARWPARLAVSDQPAFGPRGFWAWEPRGSCELFLWMARNRLNQWTAVDTAHVPLMKQLGFVLTGGGHTIQSEFLPPARYFAAHPEWYGLHDGRRSGAIHGESGDNFCTSNAEARRELALNLVASLAEGSLRHADLLELWMLDGGRWCECDACRAQGPPARRVLSVATEVAAAADSAHASGRLARDVQVATLAYLETLPPPAPGAASAGSASVTVFPYFRCYAHALFDPACNEINRRLADAIRGWAATGTAGGVCEYWNVGAFKSLPLVFPHVMAADLAGYRSLASSLRRIETMHAPSRLWGSWTLQHWLFARLAWDPAEDPDTLLSRFCRDVFPGAASPMREHYRQLELASANILALQHCAGVYGTSTGGGRLTQTAFPVFPLRHLQETESHPATDDAPDLDEIERAMAAARAALDQALAAAATPLERARLAGEERRFAYGEAMFAFYTGLIRTAARERAGDAPGARAAFAAAERAAVALRRVRDLVQVSASHANARDGLEASGVVATYTHFRERYGERSR